MAHVGGGGEQVGVADVVRELGARGGHHTEHARAHRVTHIRQGAGPGLPEDQAQHCRDVQAADIVQAEVPERAVLVGEVDMPAAEHGAAVVRQPDVVAAIGEQVREGLPRPEQHPDGRVAREARHQQDRGSTARSRARVADPEYGQEVAVVRLRRVHLRVVPVGARQRRRIQDTTAKSGGGVERQDHRGHQEGARPQDPEDDDGHGEERVVTGFGVALAARGTRHCAVIAVPRLLQ